MLLTSPLWDARIQNAGQIVDSNFDTESLIPERRIIFQDHLIPIRYIRMGSLRHTWLHPQLSPKVIFIHCEAHCTTRARSGLAIESIQVPASHLNARRGTLTEEFRHLLSAIPQTAHRLAQGEHVKSHATRFSFPRQGLETTHLAQEPNVNDPLSGL